MSAAASFPHGRFTPSRRPAIDAEPDIGGDIEMRKQIVFLEDHRDRPLCRIARGKHLLQGSRRRPASGVSKPATILRRVDLPEPRGAGDRNDLALPRWRRSKRSSVLPNHARTPPRRMAVSVSSGGIVAPLIVLCRRWRAGDASAGEADEAEKQRKPRSIGRNGSCPCGYRAARASVCTISCEPNSATAPRSPSDSAHGKGQRHQERLAQDRPIDKPQPIPSANAQGLRASRPVRARLACIMSRLQHAIDEG